MGKLPNINARIKQLIDVYANGRESEFAKQINVSQQTLNRLFNKSSRNGEYPQPTTSVLCAITNIFVDVNARWLLTGDGDMFAQSASTAEPMPEIFEKILLRKDNDIKEQASQINELIKVNTRLEVENEQLKKMFATSENFANISSTKKNQISENL